MGPAGPQPAVLTAMVRDGVKVIVRNSFTPLLELPEGRQSAAVPDTAAQRNVLSSHNIVAAIRYTEWVGDLSRLESILGDGGPEQRELEPGDELVESRQ